MRIFEFKDKNGRVIYLTDERWEHISKEHPKIINYIHKFNKMFNTPTKIVDSPYNSNVKYYYRYYKELKNKSKYLLVIVKYLNGEGSL